MELIANLMDVRADLATWARDREAEGWPVLASSDHYFAGGSWWPHLWVSVTHMAAVTARPRITSTFANNLFRSPVEFAQASLTVQAVSGGRFEAGLGAGWSRDEVEQAGLPYPGARERADRYIEALHIVRDIFDNGCCKFAGEYYDVDVPSVEAWSSPPLLVGALGGPRTIRGATPYLDRVELKAASPATRSGTLDFSTLASIEKHHLVELVEQVRQVREDVPLGMFVLCGTGDDMAANLKGLFGPESLYGGFFGHPEEVADSILALKDFGITHPQISPINPNAFEELAPYLLADERPRAT